MKMISPGEALSGPLVREYRDISWRGLLGTGIGFALIAVFVAWPKSGDIAWLAAVFPALLSLTCFSLAIHRRLAGDNAWLMRCARDGLYINTNYGDGYALPGRAENILFVPASEVKELAAIREVMRLPHRFGATRHHFACLDIALVSGIPVDVLVSVTTQQARFKKARKSGPYPVRVVSPSRLRLNWGWIHPGTQEAMGQLSGSFATAPAEILIAYPDWETLTPGQQELYLDVLWQAGMGTESVFLGRTLHGCSGAEVGELLKRRNRGD